MAPSTPDSLAAGLVDGTVREHLPFREKLDAGLYRSDLLFLLLVPVILASVYALPRSTRRSFAIIYSDPSIVSAFTAHYVHLTRPHLLSNVIGYLVLAGTAYLLAAVNGHRKRFYIVLFAILVVFPIPLSYINLTVARPGIGFGFSALNMAIFGFAGIELTAFLSKHFTTNFDVANAPIFFFLATTFISAPYGGTDFGRFVLFLSGTAASFYAAILLNSYRPTIAGVRDALSRTGYVELLVSATLLLAGFLPVAFPQNPTVDAGLLNIYIHFLGFAVGFIAVYVYAMATTAATPRDAIPSSV